MVLINQIFGGHHATVKIYRLKSALSALSMSSLTYNGNPLNRCIISVSNNLSKMCPAQRLPPLWLHQCHHSGLCCYHPLLFPLVLLLCSAPYTPISQTKQMPNAHHWPWLCDTCLYQDCLFSPSPIKWLNATNAPDPPLSRIQLTPPNHFWWWYRRQLQRKQADHSIHHLCRATLTILAKFVWLKRSDGKYLQHA